MCEVANYEKGIGEHKAEIYIRCERYLEWLAGLTDGAQDDKDVIAFSDGYTEIREDRQIKKISQRQEAQCRSSKEDEQSP